MTDKQRIKRIERAQLRVMFQVPFFGPAVAKLPVSLVDTLPLYNTAATDGHGIKMCRPFLDSLEDQMIVTLVCHEACHCLLGHLWRMPSGGDFDTWNRATDHAVNLMLKEFAATVTAQRLADPFPFPPGAHCADPCFKGMAEEAIYRVLYQKKPPGGSGGGAAGAFGEIEKPAGDPANAKADEGRWKQTLVQCAAASKSHGQTPAGIDRAIDEMMHPRVPWFEVLRQWVRERAQDDWSWRKFNPYSDDSGFILPSLDSERVGPIIFATDTSGSIDQKLLAIFQGEKQGCLDTLRPSSLLDIYCDAKIHAVLEYRPGEEISRNAPGGGGTSFAPVFEYIAGLPSQPRALVYLTDLYGDFPAEEPAYPVFWVVYGNDTKAPFGETVRCDE